MYFIRVLLLDNGRRKKSVLKRNQRWPNFSTWFPVPNDEFENHNIFFRLVTFQIIFDVVFLSLGEMLEFICYL